MGSPSPTKGSLLEKQRSPLVRRAELAARALYRWLREYSLEWQLTDAKNAATVQRRVDAIIESVNHSDVVCFVKPGGLCPFCNMASKILVEAAADATQPRFFLHIAEA